MASSKSLFNISQFNTAPYRTVGAYLPRYAPTVGLEPQDSRAAGY